MSFLTRASESRDLSLTDSAATTPEINTGGYETGTVHVPSGSSITTLTFHSAPTAGGTYLPLYDTGGNAVTLTVQGGRTYKLPSFHGSRFTKMVANAAGAVAISLVA